MPTTVIFLESGTDWVVPSDWSDDNTIECIGGGGSGAVGVNINGGGGGGAGAYSAIADLAGLTPSGSVTIQVGGIAGDTWFNGASLAASSCGAKGGVTATLRTGAAGGAAASGIGSTKSSGGTGGDGVTGTK